MVFHILLKWKAKMMCCCKDNLVQAQDNNTNKIQAMAYMLWDIYDSYERKHI